MSVYFVSRHPGARDWAAAEGMAVDEFIAHLDVKQAHVGDMAIGCAGAVRTRTLIKRHSSSGVAPPREMCENARLVRPVPSAVRSFISDWVSGLTGTSRLRVKPAFV